MSKACHDFLKNAFLYFISLDDEKLLKEFSIGWYISHQTGQCVSFGVVLIYGLNKFNTNKENILVYRYFI